MDRHILEKIEIQQGDITRLQVDAIVNAANSSLLGGGGVDGAIHRAAGPQLLEECRAIGGCPTGEARITGGYELPATHVIHTVGPVYHRMNANQAGNLLKQCYQNSMALAEENGLRSIAFPAVSCGVYGYPIEDACRVAIDSACRFLEGSDILQQVVFILFSGSDRQVYERYLASLR